MRYALTFSTAEAGVQPTFAKFFDLNAQVAVTPPTIYENLGVGQGGGTYYFDWNWAATTATAITYTAVTPDGQEDAGTIFSASQPGSAVATPGSANYVGLDTAGHIISDAAVELGLGPNADPYASQDPNFVRLLRYMKGLCGDMNIEHNWPALRKECTFTTQANQNVYALPSDFHEFIDQSGWNRSARLPLIGPLSSQEWQYLKARSLGMFITVVFRLDNAGTIEINPGVTQAAGTLVAFEYISSSTTASAAAVASNILPDKAVPTISSDTPMYDPDLMVAGLKLAWLTDQGRDTMVAQAKFDQRLEHCIGKSTGGRTLSLTGSGTNAVDRFIDNANLPLTGFGAGH